MLLNACRVVGDRLPALILLAIEDVTRAKQLENARAELLRREQAVRAEERRRPGQRQVPRDPVARAAYAADGDAGVGSDTPDQKLDEATAARGLEVIDRNTAAGAPHRGPARRLAHHLRQPVRRRASIDARALGGGCDLRHAAHGECQGVGLESHLDGAAGPIGLIRPPQQIVANLVSNAIKFTPSGGGIEVRLSRRGPAVEVTVRDTGKGSAEQIPGLQPIRRRARQPAVSGRAGAGLAIVRHLVELLARPSRPRRRPWAGGNLPVTLPLTDDRPVEEVEVAGIPAEEPAPPDFRRSTASVLVVDDEADAQSCSE
jgi:signal transduction histidine kinase